MNLNNRITELRKQKGWSQSELAKNIEVSREIVGRYERGDAMPSIDIAKRLADAFGVSLDYLVGNSENVKDKEMLSRLQEIDKMNGENKKLVYAFLDAFITKTKLESMMK
jgi:transcriptional regulator with XRE-family HTH domain